MLGTIKKIDNGGRGIMAGSDGSTIPFILSQHGNQMRLKMGQTVAYFLRTVNDNVFAQHVTAMRRPEKNNLQRTEPSLYAKLDR